MGGSVHQVGPKVAKGMAELNYDRRLSNFRIPPMGGSVHQVGPSGVKVLAELNYDKQLLNFRIPPIGGSVHQVGPSGGKVLTELNYDGRQDEQKEVRDHIVGEGQGFSEEDESRINESAVGVNDGWRGGGVSPSALRGGLQKQKQHPSGTVVSWERILSVRTIKVLLVEDDDSTRQVVSALLRNCSYEVTAVANGSQAWKILENPVNHTDLVLTEVVMPGSSGIGLLCKIMSHDSCKNIPVIMMSSNDSMDTVFKCLSKGAVDFLVKPIRKNELRNLWQHVWRRSHSSSNSVSGIQTQNSARSKSDDDCDYNTSSNDDDNNASTDLNAREGSDHGSRTQSSWTKHAVEVDSPQPMSPSDQPGDPQYSTCAQVILDSQILYNKWVPMTTDEECQNEKEHADECMGKGLEIGLSNNQDDHHESYPLEKASIKLQVASFDNKPDIDQKNEDELGLESSNAFDEPITKAADLIGGMANNTGAQPMKKNIHDCPNGFSKISECKEKNDDDFVELPSLQLSLKRLRSTGEVNNGTQDGRTVLKRSIQSAFSRYRTSPVSTQAPTGCEGSCSPLDHSSEAMKTESTQNMISNSNPGTVKQGSNGSSDNNDMGSTTRNVFTNPAPYKEKVASTLVVKNIHPSAFHPVRPLASFPPKVMQEKDDNIIAGTMFGQPMVVQHHYHRHVHGIEKQQQQPPKHNDSSHKKSMTSSDVFAGPFEENAANYSMNISNSGSNGQNGSSPAVNAAGAKMECANVISDQCGIGSASGSRVDQNRFAQREAALNKFRQKRKERNFGNKVRYQSRKRLAEQRPRVRGQFVRQSAQEYTSREADS